MERIIINPIGGRGQIRIKPSYLPDVSRKLANFLGLQLNPESIETLANVTYRLFPLEL